MSEQAQALDPVADLLDALGPSEPPPEEVTAEAPETPEVPEEPEAPPEPQKFIVKVRAEDGAEKDEELTAEELAAGYMRNADYSRKTQELPRRVEAEVAQKVAEVHTTAIDHLNKLQALAIETAAPELLNLNPGLAEEDPAQYVRLQAKQQQLRQVLDTLEQRKTHHQQELQRSERQLLDQAIKQSEEVLAKGVKGFGDSTVGDLLTAADKHYGVNRDQMKAVASALAKAKLPPETLGKVLLAIHDGSQWRQAQSSTVKKVVEAPKVLKPSAPQPRQQNKAALDRLQKTGRASELINFL